MTLFAIALCAASLCGAAPRTETAADGSLRLFRGEASAPFAEWKRPDGVSMKVRTEAGSPFVFVDVAPETRDAERTVGRVDLGEIRLRPFAVKPVVQGTGGLTEVDGHTGSFAYAAVAEAKSRRGVVVAWLTDLKASGVVRTGFDAGGRVLVSPVADYGRLLVRAGTPVTSDTLVVGEFDDCRLGLEAYADAVAKRFGIRLPRQISGYTSWYADKYGYSDRREFKDGCGCGTERSTRELADAVVAKLKPWGFDFIQLDDQWQSGNPNLNGPARVFERCNPKGPYPNGFESTTEHLRSCGIRPGLWFMPFAGISNEPWWADKRDLFAVAAEDFCVREAKRKGLATSYSRDQRKGQPFETSWGGTCLDFTKRASHDYLGGLVRRMTYDWGFRYLKFDGMFTGHPGDLLGGSTWKADGYGNVAYADPTKTGMDNFRSACETMRRAAAPDTFILACNLAQNARSIAASYGLVDAMRCGGDNGPIDMFPHRYLAGPKAATPRYFFNGRVWYNDPDPVYVRAAVPYGRAKTATSWTSLIGALYNFSDWVPDLPEDRLELLRRTMAPHGVRNVRPVDYFEHALANVWRLEKDGTMVYGLFNWDTNAVLKVDYEAAYAGLDPAKTYVGFDFWGGRFVPAFRGRLAAEVPPDDCRIISVREFDGTRPVLVSTSRHVASPVFGTADVRFDGTTLRGVSDAVAGDPLELRVCVPDGWRAKDAVFGAEDVGTVSSEGPFVRVGFRPMRSGALTWKIGFAKE